MRTSGTILIFIGLLMLSIAGCTSQEPGTENIELTTRMDTISYIIGLDYGIGIKEENIEANQLAVFKGLSDGLAGRSVLPDSVKDAIIDEFNEELKLRIEEEGKRVLEQNKMEGLKFLEENIDAEGVFVLPSGLQYKVLKEGNGPKPMATDSVLVHYRAMFINRDVFDMSYDRGPAGIRVSTVIKGLSEGLQHIPMGGIYELYIPSELAYGEVTFANVIPAGSVLVYTIELIEIVKE